MKPNSWSGVCATVAPPGGMYVRPCVRGWFPVLAEAADFETPAGGERARTRGRGGGGGLDGRVWARADAGGGERERSSAHGRGAPHRWRRVGGRDARVARGGAPSLRGSWRSEGGVSGLWRWGGEGRERPRRCASRGRRAAVRRAHACPLVTRRPPQRACHRSISAPSAMGARAAQASCRGRD